MTYLSYPRVAFHSTDAISNVSTANNQNVVDILDFDDVRLKNPQNLSPEEYRAWLMELCQDVQQPGSAPRPTMFGYWNYYGDQLTTIGNAGVTSVLLPGDPEADDPLSTARVALSARLVDLDPADTFTSQMFTSAFVVTAFDADGDAFTLIEGAEPTVAATRWLNFNRPMGSGNFYSVVPADRLAFAPRGVSKALDTLRDAVEAGAGLAIRYCLYDFIAPNTTAEQVADMREAFLRGDYVLNPKIGRVAGTFGAWVGGDLRSAPGARWLHPVASPYLTTGGATSAGAVSATEDATPEPAPAPLSHGALDAHWSDGGPALTAAVDGTDAGGPPAVFGPAVAVVQPDLRTVLLDLMSTVPEVSPTDMTKVDVGTITLYAGSTRVGEVDYSRETYERLGGVVEVTVPDGAAEALSSAPLTLLWTKGTAKGIVAAQVRWPYAVVDAQCTYVELPDATASVEVRVLEPDGAPLASPLTMTVEQWQDYNYPPPPVTTEVVTTPPTVYSPQFGFRLVPPGDPKRMVPATLDVPAGGVVTMPVEAGASGCYKIRFLAPGAPSVDPNTGAGFTLDYFCAVRVLPLDDYSHVPDDAVTWDYVYREVFLYYALMYPIMSQYVPWGPENAPLDPDRVHTLAVVLRELVDGRNFGSSMYMPVTRELSAGKRELVRRWCDLQLVEGTGNALRMAARGR